MLQAEIALLYQVEQLHAGRKGIASGHADDQPQVGPYESVLGLLGFADRLVEAAPGLTRLFQLAGFHAAFYRLRQLALLFGVQERYSADLVQVLPD